MNIFNDFELLDFVNLDVDMWEGGGGYALSANAGAFSLTGTDVDLIPAREITMAAVSGSFAAAGTATALKKGYHLAAASGSASTSGTAVAFKITRKLSVAPGAVIESGQSVGLRAARNLAVDNGAISLSGTAVILNYWNGYTYTLQAGKGSFTIDGQPITLLRSRKFGLLPGSLAETGTPIDLLRGRKLQALFGDVSLSGSEVGLKRFAKLLLDSGTFTLTGTDIEIALLHLSADPGAFILSGSGVSFVRGRAWFVEAIYSTPKITGIVAQEKITRITGEQKVTRITA